MHALDLKQLPGTRIYMPEIFTAVKVREIVPSGFYEAFNMDSVQQNRIPVYVLTSTRRLYHGFLDKVETRYVLTTPEIANLAMVQKRIAELSLRGWEYPSLNLLAESLSRSGWIPLN